MVFFSLTNSATSVTELIGYLSMVHASLWLPVFVEVKLTIVDESLVALVLGAHHCKLLLDMVY